MSEELMNEIHLIDGDILKSTADALINPVNCVGVCGKGLAEKFKKVFPLNYIEYMKACANGQLNPGEFYTFVMNWKLFPSYTKPESGSKMRFIINFATKDHWKEPSELEWIEKGLIRLNHFIKIVTPEIKSIAIPALGCGLGGLNFHVVKGIMLGLDWGCRVDIYLPQ